MKAKLEKIFSENRDAFDAFEPEAGHFERFEARLDAAEEHRSKRANRFGMLKVAALILVLISATIFIFDFAFSQIRDRIASSEQSDGFPLEMHEAMFYYKTRTDQQLATLNELSANHPQVGEIRQSAKLEMERLDKCTGELTAELKKNPGNEKIEEAILLNQKMKEEILTHILSRITQTR